MARNIEIKARIASVEALCPLAATVADTGPEYLEQDDTFFACPEGRLKLRVFADGAGELIFYQRADTAGPKTSFYLRTPVPDPDGLRDILAHAYGVTGRVRKQRVLFLAGRTRIHIDCVADLGDFAELEVVLAEDEDTVSGIAEAHALMHRLGIAEEALIETAYVDLLAGAA
ncbi:MAG TPA: class IV adenylate cyclase [Burkholderiaceae bacterium]|nr:class IV adenylate cyclase [Burkholderiaceae bacterium]